MLITATKPESSDGHGIANIAQSIIEKLLQEFQKQKKQRKEFFTQTKMHKCPACAHMSNLMEIYNRKILELLSSRDEEFLKLLKDSKGLCIPHFITLLKTLEDTIQTKIKM